MKSKFVMLVGMPGAGKSTIAQKLSNYVLYSTDNIRNEYDMHDPNQIFDVVGIVQNRMIRDLDEGKNIVYDSTNLSRKRRMTFLEDTVNNYPNYEKICYVLNTDLDLCKERNSKRTGYARVPDENYNYLEHYYDIPSYKEGWDEIIFIE